MIGNLLPADAGRHLRKHEVAQQSSTPEQSSPPSIPHSIDTTGLDVMRRQPHHLRTWPRSQRSCTRVGLRLTVDHRHPPNLRRGKGTFQTWTDVEMQRSRADGRPANDLIGRMGASLRLPLAIANRNRVRSHGAVGHAGPHFAPGHDRADVLALHLGHEQQCLRGDEASDHRLQAKVRTA